MPTFYTFNPCNYTRVYGCPLHIFNAHQKFVHFPLALLIYSWGINSILTQITTCDPLKYQSQNFYAYKNVVIMTKKKREKIIFDLCRTTLKLINFDDILSYNKHIYWVVKKKNFYMPTRVLAWNAIINNFLLKLIKIGYHVIKPTLWLSIVKKMSNNPIKK